MNNKAIIAIVVVVILIAAGVGIGVFVANKDKGSTPEPPLFVDNVKTTVEKNDFIASMTTYQNISETSGNLFLSEHYNYDTGTDDTFTFKGKTYTCCKSVAEDSSLGIKVTTWAVKDSGFIMKTETVSDGQTVVETIADTNLDVTLKNNDQAKALKSGSFITIHVMTVKGESTVARETISYEFVSYDSAKGVGKLTAEGTRMAKDMVWTVKEVTADGVVKLTNGDEMSLKEFRSFVSISDWKEWQQSELKNNINTISKETKTIDTVFGKRLATIETMEITSTQGMLYGYTIVYGTAGFIYSITWEDNAKSPVMSESIVDVQTSMKI